MVPWGLRRAGLSARDMITGFPVLISGRFDRRDEAKRPSYRNRIVHIETRPACDSSNKALSGLNRGLSSNLYICEIYKRIDDVYREAQKHVYKFSKHWFAATSLSQKSSR